MSEKIIPWTEEELPPLEIQHLWYEITQIKNWRSMVLIPAADNIQIVRLACGLGKMALRELQEKVWVINTSGSAAEGFSEGDGQEEITDLQNTPQAFVDLTRLVPSHRKQLYLAQRFLYHFGDIQEAKAIFVVDSPISQPDSIPLIRAVDGAIICVGLGTTSLKSVRKIADIVGKEKILGSIAIRPK